MKKSMRSMMTGLVMTGVLAVSSLSVCTAFAEEAGAEASQTQELKTIGEKAEGAYEVKLKNSTGKAVKALTVEIDSEGAGENLLGEDETWADGEERILYVTPKEMKGEDAKPPVYDLDLTFEDDTKSVLHTFPFGDADEAEVLYADGVAYLKFVSLSLKSEHNTLETEKALAPAQAASDNTQAASDNTQAAYDNTQAAAVDYSATDNSGAYEEPAYDDNYNDYSYDYSYDDGGSSYDYDYDYDYGSSDSGADASADAGADAGGGDGCIDDGVILN